MIIALWLIFSIVAGIIASSKGRSGIGLFFLSLLLSPLIGVTVALCMARAEPVKDAPIIVGMKKCPFCAESIKREAVVCRYCQRDQPSTPDSAPEPESPRKELAGS